jgi:hypothetical protein
MTEYRKLARQIFSAVEADLRDRRGIRHEWDRVDESVQREIRKTNVTRITELLKRADLTK